MWVVTLYYLLCNRTHPYYVTLPTIGSCYFRAKLPPVWIAQQFSSVVILHLPAYEDGTDRVFRNVGRGITQKKTYKLEFCFGWCSTGHSLHEA